MHAITRPIPVVSSASGRFRVHGVPAASDNVVWVVEDTERAAAAIVDGPEASGALALLESHGLRLDAVLLTHGHGDHVGVVHDLDRQGRLDGVAVVGSADSALPLPKVSCSVRDGDRAPFAGAVVLRTDGHVTGHVSYLFDGLLFVGDTLFAGGCGYLFDGPPAAMWDSLQRLTASPPETRVFCAHEYTQDNLRFGLSVEPDNAALWARWEAVVAAREAGEPALLTTVGLERATNVFVRAADATAFAERRRAKDARTYRTAPLPERPR